jgi:hypothetical protein
MSKSSVRTLGLFIALLSGCGDDVPSILVAPTSSPDGGPPTTPGIEDAGLPPPTNDVDLSWCPPGRYVVNPDAAPADRVCTACPSETFSNKAGSTSCTPWTPCALGSYTSFAPSAESDRKCRLCAAGTFGLPDWGGCMPCAPGTWDHDSNAASACVPWQACPVGSFISRSPDTTRDRVCEPCAAGTYTAGTNSAACSSCLPGHYLEPLGAGVSVCKPCAGDTFSSTTNATSCTSRTTCPIGTYVTGSSTASSDRSCASCPAGSASVQVNASTCGAVAAINAGGSQTCAVTTGGQVFCWGEVAPGSTLLTPSPVPTLVNAVSVAVGARFACAVQAQGTVQCWGENGSGQLGDGTMTSRPTPALVDGLTNITRVSVWGDRVHAVRADGSVFGWGGGSVQTPPAPLPITGAVDLSPGLPCAVMVDGAVQCWEILARETGELLPTTNLGAVRKLTHRVDHDWGYEDVCALRTDGTVRCKGWRWDAWGPYAPSLYGLPLELGTTSDDLVLSNRGACTIVDAAPRCWNYGSLYEVATLFFPNISDAVALTSGPRHTCALSVDGSVRCWGSNDHGQLGDGTTTDRATAVTVMW